MHSIDGVDQDHYGAPMFEKKLLWAALYDHVLNLIGGLNGTIIPMGDAHHENAGRTIVTSFSAFSKVFDYNEALLDFDNPLYYAGAAQIPVIQLNGIDEFAYAADESFWTRDDAGGANGFSMGVWAHIHDTGTVRSLFSKWDENGEKEWLMHITAEDELRLSLFDKVAGVAIRRTTDTTVPREEMTFFAVTYDGRGGSSAGNGITLYVNGDLEFSSPTFEASYVGMRDSVSKVYLGGQDGNTQNLVEGEIAGGPFGPFWTRDVLITEDIKRLYHLGRAALDA